MRQVGPNNTSLSSSSVADGKQIAHAALREAIRELSLGSSKSISLPPSKDLDAWKSQQSSDLETEKLELLARAYFEGRSDMFPQNLPKAIELWGEASARGSLEAAYSLAICHRDGVGVDRNANEAFSMLLKLAEEKNYNLAHVSNCRGILYYR
jgi:TPR repeat protein